MIFATLLYAFAIIMLVVCATIIYFLREKRWTMMRDALDEYARSREKDARFLASARIRSRRSKGDRNMWGVTVVPVTLMAGMEVSTELRTRR